MVGVAGRSKACKTCKQRKIACSLEKPHCQICIKSNRECGGYKQDIVFVMDPRTVKAASKTPDKSKSKVKEKVVKIASPATTLETPFKESEERIPPVTDLQATIVTSSAFTQLSSIACPTMRRVYREQIISEFLHSFLPSMRIAGPGSWLSLLPTHPNFTSALEATTLAISTARLGRLNSDQALVRESLKFYTQGLWELQKALWDEEMMYKDETLAACLTLVMYEVLECPDQSTKAWIKHMKGCSKLFELRGPGNYKSDFGMRLFSSFRTIEIPHSITERRSTFLAKKEWLEIPWKGRTKPLAHRLLDIMADVADGIALAYKALGDPSTLANIGELISVMMLILKRGWAHDTKLEAFWKRFESETKGPVYWTQLSNGYNKTVLPDEELDVFPVAFNFPDMATAHTCMLYWSTCLILWSGMAFIYRFLAALPASTPSTTDPNTDPPEPSPINHYLAQLPPLGHRTNVSHLAKNICQTIEYYLQSDFGEAAASTAVFPLKVAIEGLNDTLSYENYPSSEKELAWAKEVFARICGRGVRILGNLGIELTEHSYLPG